MANAVIRTWVDQVASELAAFDGGRRVEVRVIDATADQDFLKSRPISLKKIQKGLCYSLRKLVMRAKSMHYFRTPVA